MKQRIRLLSLIFAAFCGGACSGISTDVEKLRGEVTDLRSFQAEQTAQLSTLEAQMRQLYGRLEEIEHGQNVKLGSVDNLKASLSQLERRVPPPPIVPPSELESDELLAKNIPVSTGTLFSEALLHIRSGMFTEALPQLQEAYELSYGNAWAPNILFWTGVAFDGAGETQKALAQYHKVVEEFPKHDRAPLSLLREASVLIRLKDAATAKLSLQKLIADYPKAPEAGRAREKLADLRQ